MKYTKIIIVAIYVASLTLGFKTVYAQQNVSCNNSYYINQNYVDVKVPTTNATYTLQFFMRSDYYTKAIVKDGTTAYYSTKNAK